MRGAKQGVLLIISAPSGCGKTTVIEGLLRRNKRLKKAVSATTRKPRPGEAHGKDYFFFSPQEFEEIKREDGFLEWAKVFDNSYGTLKSEVLAELRRGFDVVLAIDVDGARQIRAHMDCLSVFFVPPAVELLEKRLLKRSSGESAEEIRGRLKRVDYEIASAPEYDVIIVNNLIPQAIAAVEKILNSRREKQVREGFPSRLV